MKSHTKVSVLSAEGFLIALLVYPFLHEFGHAIATVLVGKNCVEFHLFPLPYVLCDMSNAGKIEYFIVGFAGILFPFAFSQLLYPFCGKNIYMEFSIFIIEGISALASVVSLVSVILLNGGYVFREDDIVNVLVSTNADGWVTGVVSAALILLLAAIVIIVIKQKIIKTVIRSVL